MQQAAVFNSRQKELLRTLLIAEKPVSYKELSEGFKLSTRTIQREIKSLTSILTDHELKIVKKIGSGLELKGEAENKLRLKEQLEQAKILVAYSPAERQEGITYDLLLASEPIKQYVFSKKYGVSETTISYDLDKVGMWLEKGEITLVRSPGIGIFIDGTEQQRRILLSRLLHKDITFEDWIEIFQGSKEEVDLQGKLGSIIRSRLLKFVQTDKILDVDRVLNQVLNEQSDIVLTDRNYVNLIVHVMLAMERLQSGEVIEEVHINNSDLYGPETYSLAKKIAERLEEVTSIAIPNIEVNYIALHLAGTRLSNGDKTAKEGNDAFIWMELSKIFIRDIEHYLKEPFKGDQLLYDGLVAHFGPAFNRLKHGLQIHNPMLEKIREKYPDIFAACQNACVLLSNKTGYHIPEDEIGYLAMHIGASQMRNKEQMNKEYGAVVVCASGLGTSTYLATRISTEMPGIHIKAIVSMNKLAEMLKEGMFVDIVISTVSLPFASDENVVIVSPFLKQDDLERIQQALTTIELKSSPKKEEEVTKKSSSMLSLATYGEGITQILRNFTMYHNVQESFARIAGFVNLLQNPSVVGDRKELCSDLEKREKIGGFVLSELAMIHTKSKGVNSLLVTLFRMKEPILWQGDDQVEHPIQTVLLLAVPKDAPKEHTELISEITAMLVEESFIHMLTNASIDRVRAALEDILLLAFELQIVNLQGVTG